MACATPSPMIVSHRHRFIYIKTYKTASTSIEAALSAVCGPDDVITPASEELMKTRAGREARNYRLDHPMVPRRPLLRRLLGRPERAYHPSVGYYEHMPAWRVRNYVGEEIWSSYYKFSFERNPWERQVSWFFYKTKSKADRPEFAAFLRDKKRAYVENFDLYSIGDQVCLDFVGRYESLAKDFQKAMQSIGMEKKIELPLTNASPRQGNRDYRKFYDAETRDRMARWYAREIDLFGYG
ncbi:MAG: sulfotransferase family 2 domain-containing protein, partial [Hyphomicrobiales bacterium]